MSIEKTKAAIASLDHVDDASWESDGRPRASAVTVALADPGVTVTDEDVAAAAPTYRRMSVEEIALAGMGSAGADDEDSKPEADPRIKAATGKPGDEPSLDKVKPLTVADARAKKEALDAEYVIVDRQLSELTARKTVINKERDKLLPILEPQAGNTLAETIQAYQRRSHLEQEKRVSNIQKVNAALGVLPGMGTAGAPSPLDASFQKNTGHGIGRKVQPGGVVTKPVAPAANKTAA